MYTTSIAGVPVVSLVEQFGSPTYIYDQQLILERINALRAFPVIRYAQKANSNLAILDLMRRQGVVVDAVSAGEIYRALQAGYAPEQIVYTSDIFDHPALELVERHQLRVNCGSYTMIAQLGQRCPNREITLRLNPGFGHGHSQKTNTGGEGSKHGIWHEQLSDCMHLAQANKLRITGLHMHIGSGADFTHLAKVCEAMVAACQSVGPGLQIISTGGGLPTPYRPTDQPLDIQAFTCLWLQTKQRIETMLGHAVEMEVEPGRYLVAEAGYLVAEIRAVKQQGSHTYYLLNAGFNNLARPVLYGAYHPMTVCPRGELSQATPPQTRPVVVGGPLCESGDIFTQIEGGYVETRDLPLVQVGDYVVIGCAGAYSFTMGSNYNSCPLAAEVLLVEKQPYLIRERQSLDDLIRGEHIPAYSSARQSEASAESL